jgi:hypothetical protein
MNIEKKPIEIGKSALFFEFDRSEFETIQEAFKLLLVKKSKALGKIEAMYEGQAPLYLKMEALRHEIKFIEHVIKL